jgi:hypothetical protein
MSHLSNPLTGRTLGISISESSDLQSLGFSEVHFRDALTEFARYMLAAGATIAYGGDLREGGFTHTLFDLVSTYKGAGGNSANRIRNYLAWPIHLKLTVKQKAELQTSAEIVPLPAPDIPGLDQDAFLPPINAESTYAWCLSLTRMRERLGHDNDAQILMGGRLIGYKGKYPGVVEEAYEFMKTGKPLYLIGAYGGAVGAVIESLQGSRPPGLTEQKQIQNDDYRAAYDYFNQHAPESEERIDYEKLVQYFNKQGVSGLNNGLTAEENERLFTSPHLPEIIALILQGLLAVKS